MTLAYGLFGFGYVITATFLVAIVRSTPAIRELEPVIWVVVGLAAAPSVLFWSYLGRRIGVAAAFGTAALAEAVGVLASVVWPSTAGICAAAVLVGGTFMGLTAMGLMRGGTGHRRPSASHGGDDRRVRRGADRRASAGGSRFLDMTGVVRRPKRGGGGGILVVAAWLARR